jgi:FtsH-binding integral membrane protein
MEIILICFAAGIGIGFLLRSKKRISHIFEKISLLIVAVLLLFLGLTVGSNQEVLSKLASIGSASLLIALFSIAGSVFFSYIVYRLFLKKTLNKNNPIK